MPSTLRDQVYSAKPQAGENSIQSGAAASPSNSSAREISTSEGNAGTACAAAGGFFWFLGSFDALYWNGYGAYPGDGYGYMNLYDSHMPFTNGQSEEIDLLPRWGGMELFPIGVNTIRLDIWGGGCNSAACLAAFGPNPGDVFPATFGTVITPLAEDTNPVLLFGISITACALIWRMRKKNEAAG